MSRGLFTIIWACLALLLVVWAVVRLAYGPIDVRDLGWGSDSDRIPMVSVDLSDLLALDQTDRLVFRDGRQGWFTTDPSPTALRASIGIRDPQQHDTAGGNSHQPTYCAAETSKIIWSIQNDRVAEAVAFCDGSRMDLAALKGSARPVEMHSDELGRDEVLALIEDVDIDPNAIWVTRPNDLSEFSHQQVILLPFIWGSAQDLINAREDLAHAFRVQISKQTSATQGRFSVNHTFQLLPIGTPEAAVKYSVLKGQTAKQKPKDLILVRPRVTIRCDKALCRRMASLDLRESLFPYRDEAMLQGVSIRGGFANGAMHNMQRKEHLLSVEQKPEAMTAITYLTRFMTLQ